MTLVPTDPSPAPFAPLPQVETCLFGCDSTPGVVAVEIVDREAVLIRAEGEERVRETRPFRPWLVAGDAARKLGPATDGTAADSSAADAAGSPAQFSLEALELDASFGPDPTPASCGGQALEGAEWTRLQSGPTADGLVWLVEFPTWSAFCNGRDELRAQGLPQHAYGSPVKQFLIQSGVTLFKGMEFDSVRRMQIDLETTSLRPNDPDAEIFLIAVSDNRGGEWALAGEDERTLLEQLAELIRQKDPDVIEGHNLFGFDLPYLAARAEALRVPLNIGRNETPLSFGRERNLPIGGITRPFKPAYLWGRHLIDTLFGVQRFDVARGELESHGLKQVATHYGIASEERVYLDRSQITNLWKADPERVRRYAAQDVEETRKLAELVLPTEFYQSQMVPESYQTVATGGSGEKINSLVIREYLRQRHAIPQPQPPVACPGGHTEIRETGVLRRVVKADVESLYPSIMLTHGIKPAGDTLGIFLPMLSELTARRLDAKAKSKRGGPDAAYWDGLQSSFKILINSFYGYLGAPFHFNDFQAATRVTTTGQELVKRVADELERTGSKVIEIDTDGVYFVPPATVKTEAEETEYVAQVGQVLPDRIRLAYDGRYAAMVSLKIKNYVLVGYDGKKTVKGASLRSRADEPYGREFLMRAIDYLVAGNLEGLARDYETLSARITQGELPVEQFARRERVTEKTFRSDAKKRSREVAGDAAVGEWMLLYEKEDGALGLAENYAGDEDRWYYLDKLYKFASRLEGALGPDFNRVFPRPVRKRMVAEQAGQLSLF